MSESDVHRRQILKSIDVRFWRLKTIPTIKEKNYGSRSITYVFKWNRKSWLRHLCWFQIENNPLVFMVYTNIFQRRKLSKGQLPLNPLKPEFTIVIFIHYKQRIAVAILDLQWMNMTWSGWQMKKILLLLKQFHDSFCHKPPGFRKLSHSSVMWNDVLMHREGLKG